LISEFGFSISELRNFDFVSGFFKFPSLEGARLAVLWQGWVLRRAFTLMHLRRTPPYPLREGIRIAGFFGRYTKRQHRRLLDLTLINGGVML